MSDENTSLAPVDEFMQGELELLIEDANRQAARSDGDLSWLPDWYLRKLLELDAAERVVKAQAQRICRQFAAARKALEWKYGRQFQAQVNQDILSRGGTKKSVDYLFGRAGFRRKAVVSRVVVDDEDKALAAAEFLLPDAVTRKLKPSVVLKYTKTTGEVLEGTHLEQTEEEERFYTQVNTKALEEGDTNVHQGEQDAGEGEDRDHGTRRLGQDVDESDPSDGVG